jgi:hypothetical protein
MEGTEPPSRYRPANLANRPSQREALSCLVQSLRLFFLRFLRLFAAIDNNFLRRNGGFFQEPI